MSAQILQDKRIILGVSGSISIYKSLELLQILKKLGACVKVVMSEEAKKFISPLLFESLSGSCVLHAQTESWAENGMNHISLAQWGEALIIAPATANTINKIAAGIADNLLLSTCLAFQGFTLIAPAANTAMFTAISTQRSLQNLTSNGCHIIHPISKELACGTHGVGALQDPEEIALQVARILLKESFWYNRSVIVSGGGSIERIDQVRYISNFSSGKMAQNLCLALYLKGAHVTLVSASFTPHLLLCNKLTLPKAIRLLSVESAKEYRLRLQEWIADATHHSSKTPFLFMAAAISDYSPAQITTSKLKKEELGVTFKLELKQNDDILASLPKDRIRSIGFKLENKPKALQKAQKALQQKNLDAICLNTLESNPLGSDENELHFITDSNTHLLPKDTKLNQSFHVLNHAALLGEKL